MLTQPARRRRLAIPAVAGVVAVAILAATPPANAQNSSDFARQAAKPGQAITTTATTPETRGIPVRAGISSMQADKLAGELGPKRTAGVYFDQATERMVVTVTDAQGERAVTAAGGIVKRVKHSTEELKAVRAALDGRIDTPGTTWGTEVIANRINVTADSTVSDVDFAEIKAVLEPFGDAARLTRIGGKQGFDSTVNGGKYISSGDGVQCSAGFNVRKKDNPSSLYLLTAGHCTVGADGVANWYTGAGEYFGYDAGGRFPGTDYGLIKHYNANVSKPGNVYWHGSGNVTDITHSRDPGVGEAVCLSGYRSGVQCGTVWELNVTRQRPGDDVHGLFRTNICTNPGDSGGPIFHNDAALGIHSGSPSGSTDCIAYHQPVNPALSWYGVEVY